MAPEYQPRVDLITTIRDLKEGLEAMKFADENFRNSRFMRLKVLAYLRDRELLNEKLEWANRGGTP